MKKVIVMYAIVDYQLLRKHFEVVETRNNKDPVTDDCDFLICSNTVPEGTDMTKTILTLTEPPHTAHRQYLYDAIKTNFHTVFTFQPTEEHHFPFSDNPIYFPYCPAVSYDIIRKDPTSKLIEMGYELIKKLPGDQLWRLKCH